MSVSALDAPIVLDANILFSALLREGTTRHLLLHGDLELHTPESIWDEFGRNREYLLEKSKATESAFELLLDSLRSRIGGIPLGAIRSQLEKAREHLGADEELDAPYVAAAMAIDAILWTQDKALSKAAPIPVVSTADVVKLHGLP